MLSAAALTSEMFFFFFFKGVTLKHHALTKVMKSNSLLELGDFSHLIIIC